MMVSFFTRFECLNLIKRICKAWDILDYWQRILKVSILQAYLESVGRRLSLAIEIKSLLQDYCIYILVESKNFPLSVIALFTDQNIPEAYKTLIIRVTMPPLKPLWYSLWYLPVFETWKIETNAANDISERQRSPCPFSFCSCRRESKLLTQTVSLGRESEENYNKLLTND